jgi:hypothetical protein
MMGEVWRERVSKRSGVVRSGQLRDSVSLPLIHNATGVEPLQLSRTTQVLTPTRTPGSISICTFRSACPYAESVTLPCIRDSTSAPSAKPDTPSTMSAGPAFHQMSDETRQLLKRSGEELDERVRRIGERSINVIENISHDWVRRRIVFLRDMKSMKFREVGKEFGMSTSKAANIYYREKERMRKSNGDV